jgi:hypothetical protein
MDMNDHAASGIMVIMFLGIPAFFLIIGAGMGGTFSEPGHIELGRTKGIIFCNEKPKDCKYEYDYMKYLETRRNQK